MFKINDFAFDTEAKETIRITNGIEKDGILVPTEAMALRCIGWEKNKAIVGWTYRQVKADSLRPLTPNKYGFNFPKRGTKYFIGRI